MIMASYCLVLLVLAFFVFSANAEVDAFIYCDASNYNDEEFMTWLHANGLSCQPITSTTTTPSISSKKIEVDCGGSEYYYVDENVLEWLRANNLPCHPTGSKKSNKLSIILGTVIPIFCLFWAVVGFMVHHKRKTAAIAAISAGQADGGNKHTRGSPTDVIKINIYDQTTTGIGN